MQYHGAAYAENVWDVFWYEKNIQGEQVKSIDNRFYAVKSQSNELKARVYRATHSYYATGRETS